MRADSFVEYVLDELAALGTTARAMFGGHGLYRGDEFFGILHQGRLYLRTDETSRDQYRALGMGPFRPTARQTLASYYEVPPEVLEDGDRLRDWARAALAARASRPSRNRNTGRAGAGRPRKSRK